MTALMTSPAEEERAALRQHRHMQKMQREAERQRDRERRAEQRKLMRELTAKLHEAERVSRGATRAYERTLDAVRECPEHDVMKLELRLRQCDRAFNQALAASTEVTFYRRKLEEASRG